MHLPPALSAFSFCSQTSENFWGSSGSLHCHIWTNCRTHQCRHSLSPRLHPVSWHCHQEREENDLFSYLTVVCKLCVLFTNVDRWCIDTAHRSLTLHLLHLHCVAPPPCPTWTRSWLGEKGERWAGWYGEDWCDTECILTGVTLRKCPSITSLLPLRQRQSGERNIALIH